MSCDIDIDFIFWWNSVNILTKNFLVYGTGKSGKSAVSFLLSRGAKIVYTYDDNVNSEEIKNTTRLSTLVNIEKLDIECVILSPGVNVLGNKNIELLTKKGIDFMSEFCLGFMFSYGKKICITGTNGKTTTVNLVYNMLKQKYKDVYLCGNTDTPITKIANLTNENSILVCEVSSFALETAKKIKPYISSILNIGIDHISRHGTFENYSQIKKKITSFQDANDYFVCNSDFNIITNANCVTYSTNEKTNGAYLYKGYICYQGKRIINKKQIKLKGDKNLENILCAVSIAKLMKVSNHKIKNVIKNFKGLPHRLTVVYSKNNITYIDDSKATNPDSTICALDTIKDETILLLGGSDKGFKYDDIFKHTSHVKMILTFGEMAEKIKQTAINCGYKEVLSFKNMEDAVIYAISIARSKDVVLLSPACASYDEFNGYAERGERFAKIVAENED